MVKTQEQNNLKLINNSEIDINYIEKICKKHLGDIKILNIYPINKGYGHKSWKIETLTEAFLFKVNIRRASLEEFNNEITAQELAKLYEINVPDIITTGTLERSKWNYFYIQRWIKGEDGLCAVPKMTLNNYNKFFYEMGTTIAKLHKKHGDFFSEDIIGNKRFESWKSRCYQRVNSAIKSLKNTGIISGKTLNSVDRKINRRIIGLSNDILPSFLHGDLHLGNVIVNGGKIAALIDFESSRYGDKYHDFVKLDNWVFKRYDNSYKEFISGYKSIYPLSSDFEERFFLYKGIEYLYSINYFGVMYPDTNMLNSFVKLLCSWNNEMD